MLRFNESSEIQVGVQIGYGLTIAPLLGVLQATLFVLSTFCIFDLVSHRTKTSAGAC